jgi:outer membrane lipopolysaccharide assembly protein LptE/RlpB
MKRGLLLLGILLLAAALLPVGGCGYRVGNLMHPQVHSIAIAPVKNETMEPMAGTFLQQALREQFSLDGSLTVKEMGEADCILYGRIVDAKTTHTSSDTKNDMQEYRAAEWAVKVTFEYTVIIPGRANELIERRQVTGTAVYQVATDPDTARRRGVQQACRNAAQTAVVYTVEAW